MVSYGTNLGEALVDLYDGTRYTFDEYVEVYSDGIYDRLERPYDMPPEDKFAR